MLETTSLGKAAAVDEDAIVVPFQNTKDMILSLKKDEIAGLTWRLIKILKIV